MGQIIRSPKQAVTAEITPDQYLTFRLGDEIYGISVLRIKKIIEFGNVTRLPMMPSFICGILNLLGKAVPVIDLLRRFGESSKPATKHTCIVIVEVQSTIQGKGSAADMGIVVDAVDDVVNLLPENIAPAPDLGKQIRSAFIQGIGKSDNAFVTLLNMDAVFSEEEI
ncbi:MAG: chemotaxis protein CheW [Gammaproteobacteria bacterium]|nr:chemotaxis protein CheW [Gammaproteobacteria bacterium]